MIDGIILAAGYSSRAKTNKMMLPYRSKPLISHAIETIQPFCERVICVTGHFHQDMIELLETYPNLAIVYNPDYPKGMFSSIKAGVQETNNDFFIIPGDYPLVKPTTYQKLFEGEGKIRVPSFSHHLGHPIFFDKEYKNKILKTTFDNLKSFRNSEPYSIIEVDDPGILLDIDHMKDYNALLEGNDEFDSK